MRIGSTERLIRDQQGGMTVEFVALLPAFLFLTFFIFEVGVAVFWVGTVEKAAQLGARLAIVSNSAATGLVVGQTNGVRTNFIPGQNCDLAVAAASDPCVRFTAPPCVGGTTGCSAGFDAIFNRMDAIAPMLERANVSISYTYAGLGFAGGPVIPRVTVTIGNKAGLGGTAVPYDTFTMTILAGFMRIATDNPSATSPFTNLPLIEATFTGEDINSAGAP